MDECVAAMTRRSVLAGSIPVLSGLSGCVNTLGSITTDGADVVSILAAGSLYNALENGFRSHIDVSLQIEAHGSVEAARLVADNQKNPDIVAVADTALFESPLSASWYATFAANALVIAYDPSSPGGQRLRNAGSDGWYDVLGSDSVRLGRTDPDLDPLGYRSLFLFDLATEYYDTERDLRAHIPRQDQLYPETQLVSQFETGGIDAAIVYRNMAVERDYAYVSLPGAIDLSDPSYREQYNGVTYELPSGTTVRGDMITYGATIRQQTPTVNSVFATLTSGSYLNDYGLTVPAEYPEFHGNVPNTLSN